MSTTIPSITEPVMQDTWQETGDHPMEGIALCLSGGGYRAMLFHIGAIWRLNEAGLLPQLHCISSVSGGSITAGVLGLNWKRLEFDSSGVAHNFPQVIARPLQRMGSEDIDIGVVLKGIALPGSISDKVVHAYQEHLYGTATLQELPDSGPEFIFNATNVQTGTLWRFSKAFMGDYRVGIIASPKVQLAEAVACSSAFPPFLSPHVVKLRGYIWNNIKGADLHCESYTQEAVLCDGGVYDNLGLEPAWKRFATVLVSDGGQKMSADPSPHTDWLLHTKRILDVVDNQVRSLRKRHLIASYLEHKRKGAYWGIRTNIADYKLKDAFDCPYEQTQELAAISTRLAGIAQPQQEKLINWGYAVCDTALRAHVMKDEPRPAELPYPLARV